MIHSVPQHILLQNTNGVNFYNILTQETDEMKTSSDQAADGFLCEKLNMHCFFFFFNSCLLRKCFRHHFVLFFTASLKRHHIRPLHRQSLSELMNGPIRQKLGVIPKNVTWGGNYSFYDLQRYFCVKKQNKKKQLILTRVSTTCFFRTS